MKKTYTVHYGVRYTTDFTVEAESENQARKIGLEMGSSISLSEMDFADDDIDVWEE